MDTLNDREKFFYDHAGFSHAPTEDPEQGKIRCARQMAAAEAWSLREGWEVTWESDDDGDHSYLDQPEFAGYEVESCEVAILRSADGEVLASLGCIDDATPEYRRVVEAELAQQAMDEAEKIVKAKPKSWNYYRAEIADVISAHEANVARHPDTDVYRLKVTGSGSAQTKWLSLKRDQLLRIAEIMAEGDV